MSKPPEASRHHNSRKLLILLPLRAIQNHSFQYETPCRLVWEEFKLSLTNLITNPSTQYFSQTHKLQKCNVSNCTLWDDYDLVLLLEDILVQLFQFKAKSCRRKISFFHHHQCYVGMTPWGPKSVSTALHQVRIFLDIHLCLLFHALSATFKGKNIRELMKEQLRGAE